MQLLNNLCYNNFEFLNFADFHESIQHNITCISRDISLYDAACILIKQDLNICIWNRGFMKKYKQRNIVTIDKNLKAEIMQEFGVSAVIAELFILRGFDSTDNIRAFINAGSYELISPGMFRHMGEAVCKIKEYVDKKEKITVYGDYDADGVCAVTVLYGCLKRLGAVADYYIPNRQDEGYGLNMNAIGELAAGGTRLLITVDCGIASYNEIAYAQSLGLEVIVTDHHEPQEELELCTVINPKTAGESYPYNGLCGTAVAAKLACALEGKEMDDNMFQLAMTATIADVMPLTGENRTIVIKGLKSMKRHRQIGLFALAEAADLDTAAISADNIAYGIVPRLNAAGRMGDASVCVELLTETDKQRAAAIAERLNKLNSERQALCTRIYNEAVQLLENSGGPDKVIVLQAEGWQHSVIGIVAARICERYNRPTILLDEHDGISVGSGRSVEGFSLFNALTYAKDVLIRFGGHDGAAGLTVEAARTEELKARLIEYFDKMYGPELLTPAVYYDMEIKTDSLTLELAEQLTIFEPTGAGNPEPAFLLNGAAVQSADVIGKNRDHVRMKIGRNGQIEALAWGAAPLMKSSDGFPAMDAIVTAAVNCYHGRRSIKAFIKDFTPLWYGALRYPAKKRMYASVLEIISGQSLNAFDDDGVWQAKLKQCLEEGKHRVCVTVYTQAGLDYASRLRLPVYFNSCDGENGNCIVIAPSKETLLNSLVFPADGIAPDCPAVSVRRPDRAIIDELMPKKFGREYMAGVYRCIKIMEKYCTVDGVISAMDAGDNCFEVLAAISVFCELGLAEVSDTETIRLPESGTKALTDSILFNKLCDIR